MPNIRVLLLAAFAVFFVSGVSTSSASDTPTPRVKPAEKAAPACNTITKFFGLAEFVIREHRDFLNIKFGFVKKDAIIILFRMSGPCIEGKALVIRKDHEHFGDLYRSVFAGWDV